jgi:hypothetical protein
VGSNPDYVPYPRVVQPVANLPAILFIPAISMELTEHFPSMLFSHVRHCSKDSIKTARYLAGSIY